MHIYHLTQWLLFFFIYCFLGWCFESTYVSLKEKKWINRGFINGPFLPLYGSGAICVLFATLPFQDHWTMVYLVGAIAATVLEYVTGVCMEKLFKVRYWDYSHLKFNFHGHICLTSTLAWGGLSLAMVYVIQRPIAYLVLMVPDEVVSVITVALTIYVAIDFAKAFHTAIDLRDVLIKVDNMKEELHNIQKRLETIEIDLPGLERTIHMLEATGKNIPGAELLKNIQERLEHLKTASPTDFLEKYQEELSEMRIKQAILKERVMSYFSMDKEKMLRRNPTAKSLQYQAELEELRRMAKVRAAQESGDYDFIIKEDPNSISNKNNK